jgi:hypothetical protein
MHRKTLLAVLALALAATAFGQTADQRFYKLDFVVKEVEGGKAVNSRTFSSMLGVQLPGRETPGATIRAGGRVPVSPASNPASFSYFDLGVNIDARDLRESQADVSVYLSVDISTIGQETAGAQPVVRQNKWAGTVLVPVKKATVVFASDDVTSKRQLQLEMTATPVK